MRSLFTLLFVFLCLLSNSPAGSTDTLRAYSSESPRVFYRNPDISMQAMRFTVTRPGFIDAIRITVDGDSTGTARLRIFGQEGGAPAPFLENDLVEPRTIVKSKVGAQTLTLRFAEGIPVNNDQFFVAIDKISPGLHLLSDAEPRLPSCASPASGAYYLQCLKHNDGSWHHGTLAYLIEVDLHFDTPTANAAFQRDSLCLPATLQSLRHNTPLIACADFNSDSYMDLLLDGRMLFNKGDGSFVDKSELIGGRASGLTILIDMDNDAAVDVIHFPIPAAAKQRATLYRNDGSGNFRELPFDAPILHMPSALSVADINNDKLPDLFIGQDSRAADRPLQNFLLINTDGRSFTDYSELLGAVGPAIASGASFIDFNNDGLIDLYIANSYRQPSRLLRNEGSGELTDVSSMVLEQNGSTAASSSGGHWFDFDSDGVMDLLSPRSATLLRQREHREGGTAILAGRGAPDFGLRPGSREYGLQYEELQSGGVFGDINNDGLPDCIITTGCPCRPADAYLQRANRRFELQTAALGLGDITDADDAILADLDNNGSLDLVTVTDGMPVVFKNKPRPGDGNWLALDLASLSANAQAIGAQLTAYVGEQTYCRALVAGRGRMMQDPLRIHIGLGDARQVDSLAVQWPTRSGGREVFRHLSANKLHRLVEGQGDASGERDVLLRVDAFPNPFNSAVTIAYRLSETAQLSLRIFNSAGHEVIELLNEQQTAGDHTIQWNGADPAGNKVAAGSYIFHCSVNGKTKIGKLTVVR